MSAFYRGREVTHVARSEGSVASGEPWKIEEDDEGYVTAYLFGGVQINDATPEFLEFTYKEEPRRGRLLEPGTELEGGDVVDVYAKGADKRFLVPFELTRGLKVRAKDDHYESGGYTFGGDAGFRLDIDTWSQAEEYEVRLIALRGEPITSASQLDAGDIIDIAYINRDGVRVICRDQEVTNDPPMPSSHVRTVDFTFLLADDVAGGSKLVSRVKRAEPKLPEGVPYEEIRVGDTYRIVEKASGQDWGAAPQTVVYIYPDEPFIDTIDVGGGVFAKEWIDEGDYRFIPVEQKPLPRAMWITRLNGKKLASPMLAQRDGDGDYLIAGTDVLEQGIVASDEGGQFIFHRDLKYINDYITLEVPA